MRGPLLAGIDVGTSRLKVCVFDTSGRLLSRKSDGVVMSTLSHGRVDMDLVDLTAKLVTLMRGVAEEFGPALGSSRLQRERTPPW